MTRGVAWYPHPPVLAEIPLGGHAVVEASAGTGKTYIIEHLVVDRLLRGQGVDLGQVLVVTFTEKATSELRKRIRDLVERVLRAEPGPQPPGGAWRIDGGARARLEAALFAFDRAPIHTIHGFCHRVLFDLAFDSGQLFDQTLVDTTHAFGRAFRDALRSHLAVVPEQRERLQRWLASGRDEASLQALLLGAHRHRYLEAAQPLEAVLPGLMAAFAEDFDRAAYRSAYAATAIQERAVQAADAALAGIEALLAETDDLSTRMDRLGRLDARPLLKPYRVGRSDKPAFPGGLDLRTRRFVDRLDRLLVLHALARSMERETVDAFLPPVAARLARMKRAQAELDFDDLLGRVWAALSGPGGGALAATLRARYRYALIDEFQDTDERQWDIFRRIFVDAPEDGQPRALYVIGDPKQAIYGFRGADVHAYLAARKALAEHTGRPPVPLAVNYRSSAPLIEAINQVFHQTDAAPFFTGEIRYDHPVRCGATGLDCLDGGGQPVAPVTLWRYDPPPPRGHSNAIPKTPLRDAFTGQLARSLRRLLFEDAGRLTLVEGETRRTIRPRDVFVLVRTGWDARDVAEALRAAGVPHCIYRQEGLFQTAEARDVRDVLRAVADPQAPDKRLRAFATPFFGVPWADLGRYREAAAGHPFTERLHAWQRLAELERYGALFQAMLHESGLVARELLFADSERELANYQHILEILLEVAVARGLSIDEVGDLVDRYRQQLEAPEGTDGAGNVQRLPGEQDAVQVMTIHKSKGLQAPVVCLYGGFGRRRQDAVSVVHDGEGRQVLIGATARETAADRLEAEAVEEDQRLLYVALTRAQVKLFVPWVDSTRPLPGSSYAPLKERLCALARRSALGPPLFDVVDVADAPSRAERPDPRAPLDAWRPPADLLAPTDEAPAYAALRARHAPMLVTSYSRMKAEQAALTFEPEADAPDGLDTVGDDDSLPGGRHVGSCLHEIIEALPFPAFAQGFRRWSRDPAVLAVFDQVMRRHAVDPRWLPECQRLIHETLTATIPLGDGTTVPGLWRCPHRIEMEFLFPLPEAHHPLLDRPTPARARWRAERGYVKGFVDFVFRHEGRTWIVDWKSDRLPAYDLAHLDPHVQAHYALQAELYTIALVRWLGIRDEADYQRRFGGMLYVFLRAMRSGRAPADGVWCDRPSWARVVQSEQGLLPPA